MSSKEALYLSVYHSELGQNQTPAVWITLLIFVHSAHLNDQNLFSCFKKKVFIGEWIVVSIYKEVIHHWGNISRGKQNSFHLSCQCILLCLFLTNKMHLKVSVCTAICLYISIVSILFHDKFSLVHYFHFLIFHTPPKFACFLDTSSENEELFLICLLLWQSCVYLYLRYLLNAVSLFMITLSL